MRRAVGATAAGWAILLAGCGGGTSERDRVEAYFKSLDRVQENRASEIQAANNAYRQFSAGKLKGAEAEQKLRQAELVINDIRGQIAALHPPARARRLQADVLRAFDLNVLMAGETRELAHFLPRAQTTIARLPKAKNQLRKDLKKAKGLKGQSRALKTYGTRVFAIHQSLAALRAPAALEPVKKTQLRVLIHTRTLSNRLVKAIAKQDKPAIERLLDEFSRGGDPHPEQAAWATGALKAYKDRVAAIDRAAADVRLERAKIIRVLDS